MELDPRPQPGPDRRPLIWGIAAAVLGASVGLGVLLYVRGTRHAKQNAGDTTVSNCRYAAADGSTISLLLRHQPGQGSAVASAIESLKTTTYEGVETEDITGIGDAALFAPALGGQLNVFAGDDFLVFTGGTLDQLRPVAEAALA